MARQNAVLAELESLKERFGNQAAVAELLYVDKSSVTRWLKREDKPDPENEERIAALRYVMVRLLKVFTPEVAMDWLLGVNAHLADQRPIDLIKAGRVTEVLSAIEQADTGAYA